MLGDIIGKKVTVLFWTPFPDVHVGLVSAPPVEYMRGIKLKLKV